MQDRVGRFSPTGSKAWDLALVGLAACVLLLLVVWPFIDVSLGGDQYVFLARSISHGRIDVDNLPLRYGDFVPWHGHKYLPFGPLPGALLIPVLPLIDHGMPIVVVGYALTALNVVLFYRILGALAITDERRHWTTLLYFGGTPYLGVLLVGISTYLGHVVVTTFLLLAISEALARRRLFLVGIFVGLACAARATAIGSVPFFLWMLNANPTPANETPIESSGISASASPPKRILQLAFFAAGIILPLSILLAYNYERFGSLTETGFGLARLYGDVLIDARSVGLFSFAHIPKNLFMMLLQGPVAVPSENSPVLHFPFIEPSRWGMGLFFTSPALLYVFRARIKERLVQACWIATAITLVPILTYYGIGYVQFGYRYALDFMPFLLILAARGFPNPMTRRARMLVAASVVINIWGAVNLAIWI